MKNFILILIFILGTFNLFSQLKITDELRQQLNGKETFNEIKSTINNYYRHKLSQLTKLDSVEMRLTKSQLKKWNRFFWINEYYVDESGRLGNKSSVDVNGIEEVKEKFRNESQERNQPGEWWQDGPVTCTTGLGRIDEIAFHPTNPNIIFAGSPHGGLFKTTDGGASWFPLSEYLPALGISGIAINPVNPDIIYVLSGDGDSSDNSFVNYFGYRSDGKGVFKTTDGGINWVLTGTLSTNQFVGHELAIDPTNPNVLLAATSAGLYRTNNGGITWNLIFAGNYWDVKFNTGNSNIAYIATNNTVLTCNDNGLFFNFTTFTIPNANRISIGVTPANPLRVYLLAGPVLTNTTYNGFYTSNDGGDTFNLVVQTPNVFSNTIGLNVFNDQSIYDHCIAVSPTNENEIFVGGLCVWRSTDTGMNWTQSSAYWPNNSPYMHPDIHELAFNPINQNLYCGNDGGFYRLNNNNWDYTSSGLTTSQFYHFELGNVSIPDWGGCQDNGIIRQITYGDINYQNINFGDGYDVMGDHPWNVSNGTSNDAYYTVNSSIVRNGADISVLANQSFFGNLAIHPTDENTIYVGYPQGVFTSNNKGVSWQNLGANGDWAIEMCKSEPGKYYAAGSGNMWRRNTNNTWTNITPPAPYVNTLKISDIDVDVSDEDNVVICMAGLNGNVKVFHSFNGGNNWNNITYNLPNVPVFCIVRDAAGGFYAGTSIGVFYKRIFSGIWEQFSNGLPPSPVTQIELEKINIAGLWLEGTHVHCSTFGRGMWKAVKYTSNCDVNLNLTLAQKGKRNFQASNQILSTANNYGGEGTDVKYSATNRIVLQNGFKATNGIKFRTYLQGCNGL